MCFRKIDITYEENFKFVTTIYIKQEMSSKKYNNKLKENTIDKMCTITQLFILKQRKFSKKNNF